MLFKYMLFKCTLFKWIKINYIKTALILISSFTVACSHHQITNMSDETENTIERSTDANQPINFNQYREWRATNDPKAENFAKYKEWEAAYKRWKLEQGQ